MQTQSTTAPAAGAQVASRSGGARELLRDVALRNALQKRAAGVPSYKVPEAAALLSISQEYLYRLIQADGFPAMRMGANAGKNGRYVVPAKAVEMILEYTAKAGTCVDVGELAADWQAITAAGGAA